MGGQELLRLALKGVPLFAGLLFCLLRNGTGLLLGDADDLGGLALGGLEDGGFLGLGVGQPGVYALVGGLDRFQILVRRGLGGLENVVQLHRRLGDGAGLVDFQGPFLQLGLGFLEKGLGLLVLLLQRVDDVDELHSAQMLQLFVRHRGDLRSFPAGIFPLS